MQVRQGGELVNENATATTRAGYDFAFWSENPNATAAEAATEAYDFTAGVSHSTTLYAVWQSQAVKYSIVYWHKVENIAGNPGTDKKNYTYSTQVDVPQTSSNLTAGQALSEAEVKALADANYKAAAIDKAKT